MKKLLASVAVVLALSASAAWERVGSLQVADMSSLGRSVSKLGMMCGNPLAAATMASALADMKTVKFFGPMRTGSSMVYTLFLDGDRLVKGGKGLEALDSLEFAVLYPLSKSKDEFLALHPGSTETNGLVVVNASFTDDDPGVTYVAFSKDGTWAGASDKPEQARLALSDIEVAGKSLDGDLARVRVNAKGMGAVVSAAEKVAGADRFALGFLKSVAGLTGGVRVTDAGVDFRGRVKPIEGSELGKVGQKTLGADALAFAGKSGFIAQAVAADCGNNTGDMNAQWTQVLAAVKKQGLDLGRFLVREQGGSSDRFTFDFAEAIKSFQTLDKAKDKDPDADVLLKDLAAIGGRKDFTVANQPYAYTFGAKGFESQWTASERFAATLPEAADKNPVSVQFISISSILKAIAPHAVALLPADQRDLMGPMVTAMVQETPKGIASATWVEKGTIHSIGRISADEIRTIVNAVGAVMALTMKGEDSDTDEN